MTIQEIESTVSLNQPGSLGNEQRKNLRSNLEAQVSCEIDGRTFVGISKDISRGGMFVQTLSKVEVGSHLKLEFTLPMMSLPMNLEGRVVWIREEKDEFGETRPVGFGVVFKWKFN